ncbi:hypothetical protein HYZ78_01335 [Candidatus Microgenomates bacterium]|nr:hypothetical protein [Candidatus Microgenomates bacterium]
METLNEDELPKEGLKRLLFSGKEEIASGMIEVKEVEEIRVYTLNIDAVSLYKVKCELLDELIALPDSEVINPLWMRPEELLVNWVRMGAEREVARQELSFRDKFLSEAGLESVVESADIVVDNKDDIEISVRYLSSELERQYNLKL